MMRTATWITISLVAGAAPAGAQSADPPETPPVDPAAPPGAPEQEAPEQEAPPSLDDLLGLEEDAESTRAQEIAREQAEKELERKLLQQEINDAFEAAIERMRVAADLLDVEFDPGLGTQRVQQEVIAKLDELIDAAQKSPQQQSSSSSSSSSSGSQQNPGQRGDQQGQQQNQGQQRNQNPSSDSSNMEPPPGQDAQPNGVIEEQRTEWGNLPERVRAMLLQGRQEKFSALYEDLTRAYYRRLAEDGS